LLPLLPFTLRRISRNATTRAVGFSLLNCWKNISFGKNGRCLIGGQGNGRGGESENTKNPWCLTAVTPNWVSVKPNPKMKTK